MTRPASGYNVSTGGCQDVDETIPRATVLVKKTIISRQLYSGALAGYVPLMGW